MLKDSAGIIVLLETFAQAWASCFRQNVDGIQVRIAVGAVDDEGDTT